MNTDTAIVNRIDHLMIEAEDPSFLFQLFSETLGMTVAWPLEDFGELFVSGGVCVGNVNLEFIRWKGQRFGKAAPTLGKGEAVFSSISFEPHGSTASALAELDRRGVHHGVPRPTPNWTNTIVGAPLDSPFVTFITEYHFDIQGWRRSQREDLESKKGGRLGIHEARALQIEVSHLSEAEATWDALLRPHHRPAPHTWTFDEGPAIRLVAGHRNVIRELVLGVASLKRAREELCRLGLLGDGSARHVEILPSALQGLHIRLEE